VTLLRTILGRTPLGWYQLVHSPLRFGMAIAGVAFAVVLVFMQLGFMNMLFDTTVMFHKQIKADIVLINPAARNIMDPRTFPRRRLVQALAVDGVADGEALYIAQVNWIKPGTTDRGNVTAFGVRSDYDAFNTPGVPENLWRLSEPGSALFDSGSRGDFRDFVQSIDRGERPSTEAGGRTVSFAGVFRLGASFGSEGSIIVSDQTFFAIAPRANPATPNIGMIRVLAGQNPDDVARRIAETVSGDDVKVMTMRDFIEQSRDFLRKESPIAYIFTFGVIMGLVVGVVIVFQILSADVQDHLPEYATFKAMGFTNRSLLGVVYEQSAILTTFGFVPGLLASLAGYELVRHGVSMPIAMPPDRVLLVFALTAGMCLLAGTIALRRVSKADPAEVFS
jgi:putative ABC transport system permease protein